MLRIQGLTVGFAIFLGLLAVSWNYSLQVEVWKLNKICRESSASPGEGKPVTAGIDAEMSAAPGADFKPRFVLKPGQWIRNGVKVGPFKPGRPGAAPERYVCEQDQPDHGPGACMSSDSTGNVLIWPISCARVCR